jgi:hypothetical protein
LNRHKKAIFSVNMYMLAHIMLENFHTSNHKLISFQSLCEPLWECGRNNTNSFFIGIQKLRIMQKG